MTEQTAALGTPEHDQQMADKFDAAQSNAAPEAPAGEPRPDWLPEKFATPADMARAYAELEQRQSAPKAEERVDLSTVTESDTRTALQEGGLNYDKYRSEFGETGDLSEASRAELVKAGFDDELIDEYLEGTRARASMMQQEVLSEVGGPQAYAEMTEWAVANLTPAQIAVFNDMVSGTNLDAIKLAIGGLKAQYEGAVGRAPKLLQGSGGNTEAGGYRSTQEMVAAMRDPRYKTDPAYRSDVAAKLARSNGVF